MPCGAVTSPSNPLIATATTRFAPLQRQTPPITQQRAPCKCRAEEQGRWMDKSPPRRGPLPSPTSSARRDATRPTPGKLTTAPTATPPRAHPGPARAPRRGPPARAASHDASLPSFLPRARSDSDGRADGAGRGFSTAADRARFGRARAGLRAGGGDGCSCSWRGDLLTWGPAMRAARCRGPAGRGRRGPSCWRRAPRPHAWKTS